ncbi:hypothetical protein BSKO_10866 [Bryopsis sp. KO-2023]|nr:hypothetical protein BSKO_10866 [Bryopsis sp. KO-2023]
MSAPRSRPPVEYVVGSSYVPTKPSTPLSTRNSVPPRWDLSIGKQDVLNGAKKIEKCGAIPKPPKSEGKSDNEKPSLWDYHACRGSKKLKGAGVENPLIDKFCTWSGSNLGNIAGGGGKSHQESVKAAAQETPAKTTEIEIKKPLVINKKKVMEVATGPICVWKANDTKKPPLPSVRISTKKFDGLHLQLASGQKTEGSELGHTPRPTFSKMVVQEVFYPEKDSPENWILPYPGGCDLPIAKASYTTDMNSLPMQHFHLPDSSMTNPIPSGSLGQTSSSLPRSVRSCGGPEQQEYMFGSFKMDGMGRESQFAPGQHFPQGFAQEKIPGECVGDLVLPPDPLSVPNQTQSRLVAKAVVGDASDELSEGLEFGQQNSFFESESGMPSLEEIHFPWKSRKANPLRSAVENSSGVLFSEGGGNLASESPENSPINFDFVDIVGSRGARFRLDLEELVSKEMERQSLSVAAPRPFPFPNRWKPPPGLGRDVELDFSDDCQIEASVNEGFLPRNFRTVFCSSVGYGKCPLGNWCIHAHSYKEFRFRAALQLSKEHPNSRLFPSPPENYKTKLCGDWLKNQDGKIGSAKGRCSFGEKCCWAHGSSEFRTQAMIQTLNTLPCTYKTKLCDSFLETGKCSSGPICIDAHGSAEIRKEAAVAVGAVQTPMLYKLKFCNSVFKGTVCELGHSCTFAHSVEDLRVKAAVKEQFTGLSSLGYKNPIVLLKAVPCPRLYQIHDHCSCNHFHSDKDRLPKLTYSLTLCPAWEELGKCPSQEKCPFVHDYSELRTGQTGSQIPQFCPLPPGQRVSGRTLALLKYQKLQKCISYAQDNFNYDLADADRISQYVGGDIDTAYRTYLGLNSGKVSDRLKSVGDVDVTEDVTLLTTIATGGACLEQLITIVTLFEGDVEKALELHRTRAQVMASQMKIEFSMAVQREMF